ncbi:Gfo/Idh/MocA family protein [Rheinheimera pleomorphica]|uniref:Gfo/Idh/MocA family protein n=1 Tax=Rheinheimera pleomorphica TaxID=2703963 RepID=UPI001420BB97|nr:Gfo/Idh/MocA family oxidoreductase [Rheinheimera pleomorphica]
MPQFGVIGQGSIGKRHLRNLRQLFPQARLLSVSASGNRHSSPPEQAIALTLPELIAQKPDFVIVASPANLHLQHTQALLAAGIPTLVEKPIAVSAEQSSQFMQLLTLYPQAIVEVGYCLRFLPAAQLIQQIIKSEQLGRIFTVISEVGQYLPHWRPDTDYRQTVSAQAALGGGALLELSHELDYLQWLFGPLQLCYARNRQSGLLQLDVEDISELILESVDNICCMVHLDFIQQAAKRHCAIIAANGRLEWDLIANTVTLHQHNRTQQLYQDKNYDKNNMYLAMLQAFWHKIQQPDHNQGSLLSAAAIVKLIEQAKGFKQQDIL